MVEKSITEPNVGQAIQRVKDDPKAASYNSKNTSSCSIYLGICFFLFVTAIAIALKENENIVAEDMLFEPHSIVTTNSVPKSRNSKGILSIVEKDIVFERVDENLIAEIPIKSTQTKSTNLPDCSLSIYFFNTISQDSKYFKMDYSIGNIPGGKTVYNISIPFRFESSLDMAIALEPYLYIEIESENQIGFSDVIPLSPEIIFNELIEKTKNTPLKISVMGNQGTAKTSIINDFLNQFRSVTSDFDFLPIAMDTQEKGTIGFKYADPNKGLEPPSQLMKSLKFYDTEGARQGIFPTKNIGNFFLNPTNGSVLTLEGTYKTGTEFGDYERTDDVPEELTNVNPINFVWSVISAKDVIQNEDGETTVTTANVHHEIQKAITHTNEGLAQYDISHHIHSITLVTFGNYLKEVKEWQEDIKGQQELIKRVQRGINSKTPLFLFQSSFVGMNVEDKKYVLKNVAEVVKEMIKKI